LAEVYCPVCGAILHFNVFAKQVAKRKHNRRLVLKIIKELGKVTTGELAREYQLRSGNVISIRHILNIVKELETQGKVETELLNSGRFGRTTLIKSREGLSEDG